MRIKATQMNNGEKDKTLKTTWTANKTPTSTSYLHKPSQRAWSEVVPPKKLSVETAIGTTWPRPAIAQSMSTEIKTTSCRGQWRHRHTTATLTRWEKISWPLHLTTFQTLETTMIHNGQGTPQLRKRVWIPTSRCYPRHICLHNLNRSGITQSTSMAPTPSWTKCNKSKQKTFDCYLEKVTKKVFISPRCPQCSCPCLQNRIKTPAEYCLIRLREWRTRWNCKVSIRQTSKKLKSTQIRKKY